MPTAYNGGCRSVEATAYPLFGTAGEMHGVVSVFWERSTGYRTTDATFRSGVAGDQLPRPAPTP